MINFLSRFTVNFWYAVIMALCAILIFLVSTFGAALDAAELPDETEPPVVEQPKKPVKKPTKKSITKPVNKNQDETNYELVQDYREVLV